MCISDAQSGDRWRTRGLGRAELTQQSRRAARERERGRVYPEPHPHSLILPLIHTTIPSFLFWFTPSYHHSFTISLIRTLISSSLH